MSQAPPRLRLEISLDGGPRSTRNWLDFTDRFTGDFETFRGKNWRLALDDVGTAKFQLRNHDRLLDPLYAAGTYFGKLKIRRPVRLIGTWTPPAGSPTDYLIWGGYVKRWGQGQLGQEAVCNLECSGPLWLTQDPGLPESALAAELELDNPAAWWPCGDAADAGLVDRTGGHDGVWIRSRPASAAIAPYAAHGSSYLPRTASGALVVAPAVGTGYATSIWAVIRPDQPNGAGETYGVIAQKIDPANPTTTRVQLRVATSADSATHQGKLLARVQNGGAHRCVVDTGKRLDDGRAHTVGVSFVSSTNIVLVVDGVTCTTTTLNSGSPTWPSAATTWTIGNTVDTASTDAGNLDGLAGYLQDLVVLGDDFSGRFDDYHDAAMNGWGSTATAPRQTGYMVGKLLDVIKFPTGFRTVETGVSDTQGVAALPDNAKTLLDRLTLTEDGRLFETTAGGLFFRSRDSYLDSPLATVQATFGNNAGEVHYEEAPPVQPADRLVTRSRVGRVGGDVQQSDGTTQQQDDYGVIGNEFTNGLHVSDAFAAAAAEWRTTEFGDPRTEFERIVIAAGLRDDDQTLQALTRDLDDRVRVIRRPPPAGSAAQDVTEQIVGIRHAGNRNKWRTTFSLTAALATANWLTLDDATTGKLTSGNVFAY